MVDITQATLSAKLPCTGTNIRNSPSHITTDCQFWGHIMHTQKTVHSSVLNSLTFCLLEITADSCTII